jgi:large subunit ribosomal protein L19e
MNLSKKKELASRTLKIGKDRIKFDESRLEEVKEAITKQDIKDLKDSGAIKIKEVSGRRKNIRRKNRRRVGKIKVKLKSRKEDYVKLTRKLRDYIKKLKKQGTLENEKYKNIRKKIRNKEYKSKRNLKENL